MDKMSIKIDIEKYLICKRCKFIIENPFEIECCGDLYCSNCVKYSSNKIICLNCNKKSTFRQNSFVKRIINHMIINCPFNCEMKYPSNEIRDHMMQCELREYSCNICDYKNTNKKFNGNKKEFMTHLMNFHENDLLKYNDNYEKYKYKSNLMKKKSFSYSKIEEVKDNPYGIREHDFGDLRTNLFYRNNHLRVSHSFDNNSEEADEYNNFEI